jgi:PAS domain S-box-containing protein
MMPGSRYNNHSNFWPIKKEETGHLLFQAVEQSPAIIVITGIDGNIEYVNTKFTEITQYKAQEVLGRNPRILKSGIQTAEFYKNLWETIKNGETWYGEFYNRKKDGTLYWENAQISPVLDEDKRIAHFIAIKLDVTERKQSEQALLESQQNLQDFLDNALELIQQCDPRGKIVYVNNTWCQKLKYTRQQALEMCFEQIIHPDHRDKCRKLFYDVAGGKPIQNVETIFITSDGKSIPVLANVNGHFRDGKFIRTRGIFLDLSDRVVLEEKRKHYTAELKKSNKDLEQFAHVASHDLQEPLRMIMGYLQLLKRRYSGKLDRNADDFINFAVEGAERMSHMIKALLDYSRIGIHSSRLNRIDFNNIIKCALKNLEMLIQESSARITWDFMPQITADEDQMQHLFQNLIGNAIKFHGESAPEVHISAVKQEESYWEFCIRDNGIGIALDDQERVFMIFQRASDLKKIEGTGIGLSICKRIVERHGGKIWVESKSDKGASFFFTLPDTPGR